VCVTTFLQQFSVEGGTKGCTKKWGLRQDESIGRVIVEAGVVARVRESAWWKVTAGRQEEEDVRASEGRLAILQ
jgi:hypothetical protein